MVLCEFFFALSNGMGMDLEGLADPEHAVPSEGVGFGGGEVSSLSLVERVIELFLFFEIVNHSVFCFEGGTRVHYKLFFVRS